MAISCTRLVTETASRMACKHGGTIEFVSWSNLDSELPYAGWVLALPAGIDQVVSAHAAEYYCK